jgi:hypothetical protein
LFLLSAAALAPITLGVAMHLEHIAAARACTADLAAWTATPHAAIDAAQLVPQTLPIPVPMIEPASEHALPFAFVIDVGEPHIVLSSEVDDSWASGEPRLMLDGDEYGDPSATRDVALDRLPTAFLANVGRTVRVYSPGGEGCTARVGKPTLVSEVWGELHYGEDELDGDGPRPGQAQETWEQGRKTLIAPLETDGDCGNPLWARDAALPAPAVFTRTGGPVPRAARKAMMRDPEVRDFELEFRRSFEEPNADELAKPIPKLAERAVGQRWQDARGRELFTLEFTGIEFGGCGGVDLAWAAFVPSADEGVTALDRVGDDVLAIIDLDRDGNVEVLTTTWLGPTRLVEVGASGGGQDALRERASLDGVPFFGCPC